MEDIINLITDAKIVEHLFYNVDVFWCDGCHGRKDHKEKVRKEAKKRLVT